MTLDPAMVALAQRTAAAFRADELTAAHAKAWRRDWAASLPTLGAALRDAALLAAGALRGPICPTCQMCGGDSAIGIYGPVYSHRAWCSEYVADNDDPHRRVSEHRALRSAPLSRRRPAAPQHTTPRQG